MTNTASCRIDPNISHDEAMRLSNVDKMRYFDEVLLAHPRINQVLKQMSGLTTANLEPSIILLIGPTGVGKSTVIHNLAKRIIKSNLDEMTEDPGFLPVAVVDAPATGEAIFSWREFYMKIGAALNEPLMARKLENRMDGQKHLIHLPGSGCTVGALQSAVERILHRRRTSVLVIDEAVHMMRQAKGKSLRNYMDCLKSWANTGVTLVMIGSYDLHEVTELTGQVARRTDLVHFLRYMRDDPEDARAFRSTLKELTSKLPLADVPDLTPWAEDIHVATIGCVGILKKTLNRALKSCLDNGGKWSDDHLRNALLSPSQLNTILEEALEGEVRITDSVVGSGSFANLAAMTREVEAKAKAMARLKKRDVA
jgi:hypothetical protein